MPSYPGKMGRARTQLGQSDISSLTPTDNDRVCSVGCLHPSQQRHPDKTTQDSWHSHFLGLASCPSQRQRMLLSIWLSSLSLLVGGYPLFAVGRRQMTNFGQWVVGGNDMSFSGGSSYCQDSTAFFPTSTNHKHR